MGCQFKRQWISFHQTYCFIMFYSLQKVTTIFIVDLTLLILFVWWRINIPWSIDHAKNQLMIVHWTRWNCQTAALDIEARWIHGENLSSSDQIKWIYGWLMLVDDFWQGGIYILLPLILVYGLYHYELDILFLASHSVTMPDFRGRDSTDWKLGCGARNDNVDKGWNNREPTSKENEQKKPNDALPQ